MARKKRVPYQCPRCGYETEQKGHMRVHLYNLKGVCPSSKNDLVLTDHIREAVLTNRLYHIPKPVKVPKQTISNTQIINIISSMDYIEKLERFHSHHETEQINFSDIVEQQFKKRITMLDSGKAKNYQLGIDDIIELVDNITECKDVKNLSVFLDSISNKIKIFDNGMWQSKIFEQGVTSIFEILKSTFLDCYECYVIRKIEDPETPQPIRNEFKVRLETYYKLLIAFNIDPYIVGKNDNQIIYSEKDDLRYMDCENYDIQEKYLKQYHTIKEAKRMPGEGNVKTKVEGMVKYNLKANTAYIDKAIRNLVIKDDDFKTNMLQ